MTTVTLLIGPPGAGKSTFRELIADQDATVVASSDDLIERYAKLQGKTYDEVFKDYVSRASDLFFGIIRSAVESELNLIVDRTNMTVASRKKVLSRIPLEWKKRAIAFIPRDDEKWRERLNSRPGKTIPLDVIVKMMGSYERPSKGEGFDEILEYWT